MPGPQTPRPLRRRRHQRADVLPRYLSGSIRREKDRDVRRRIRDAIEGATSTRPSLTSVSEPTDLRVKTGCYPSQPAGRNLLAAGHQTVPKVRSQSQPPREVHVSLHLGLEHEDDAV